MLSIRDSNSEVFELAEILLSVEDLHTYFYTDYGTVKAVDGVNLYAKSGETLGLVGESGCGKSITALSILRLIPPPGKVLRGKVSFDGKELLNLSEEEMVRVRGRSISMIFQDPMTYLNPVRRVGDQVAEAILLHTATDKNEAKQRATQILEKVGIPSPDTVYRQYPHQLSGGMRQRILISIAVSCNPKLLIADEPTTALDVTIQAQILALIKELTMISGTSLLLITHDLGIVADTCERCYVMYAGKIVESGDVVQIFKNPMHPYTSGLMRATLSIDTFKKDIVGLSGEVPVPIDPSPGCRFSPRCSKSMDICMKADPPIRKIGEREVACWLWI
jgi:peptide/nickel transport system ATP-binding protein